MFSLSYLGDLLGNNYLPNLGDAPGALDAYRRMAELARQIHTADPADQRARSDYAIALTRLSTPYSEKDAPEKIRLLHQAIALQQEVARATPDNFSNSIDLTYSFHYLGDALQENNSPAAALRAYRDALALAEPLVPKASISFLAALNALYRKTAVLYAAQHDRPQALLYARRAYLLADPTNSLGAPFSPTPAPFTTLPPRTPEFQRHFLYRAPAALGLTYAALGDKQAARPWLERALTALRSQTTQPPFLTNLKKEKALLEAALQP